MYRKIKNILHSATPVETYTNISEDDEIQYNIVYSELHLRERGYSRQHVSVCRLLVRDSPLRLVSIVPTILLIWQLHSDSASVAFFGKQVQQHCKYRCGPDCSAKLNVLKERKNKTSRKRPSFCDCCVFCSFCVYAVETSAHPQPPCVITSTCTSGCSLNIRTPHSFSFLTRDIRWKVVLVFDLKY